MKISFFRNLEPEPEIQNHIWYQPTVCRVISRASVIEKMNENYIRYIFSSVSRVKLCGLKLKYKFRRENFQKLTALYQAKLLVTSCVTSCRNFVLNSRAETNYVAFKFRCR